MKTILWAVAALTALAGPAMATTVNLNFNGPGVSGALLLTYGTATDAKYPTSAFEITGISGVFSDSNNGLAIVNAPVAALVGITRSTPDATNLLAPNDFSRFAVATGLSPVSNGAVTYDNLFWPGGSPQTATDYPPQGGLLDIYGVMFSIGNGIVVDLWSNGAEPGGAADYGVAVATAQQALDYVGGGVSVPEPASALLLGAGMVGLLGRRRRG